MFGSNISDSGFCLVKMVTSVLVYLFMSFPYGLVFRLLSELIKIHTKSGLMVTSSVKME